MKSFGRLNNVKIQNISSIAWKMRSLERLQSICMQVKIPSKPTPVDLFNAWKSFYCSSIECRSFARFGRSGTTINLKFSNILTVLTKECEFMEHF